MKRGFREDTSYWERKLAIYLHDPPDKPLRIPGHEIRSAALLETLGVASAAKDDYRAADQIASGMDRSQLPGYAKQPEKSGAVDFCREPYLTHPLGREEPLRVRIPPDLDIKAVSRDIRRIVETDCFGGDNLEGVHSAFSDEPALFAAARFHYVHHALRFRLCAENIGGIGALWHRLPADTRMPDHSIWQHCGLVSALSSCFECSDSRQASLMVFAFTPVQDFIVRARKLRDYWSGSLLLSWLAFEGLREIIYDLGSDHILYPAVVDQPLIKWFLYREGALDRIGNVGENWAEVKTGAASFPNKFVCLVPAGKEHEHANCVEEAIRSSWKELGRKVVQLVGKVVGCSDPVLASIFDRQVDHYFQYHWAASPLFNDDPETREHMRAILAPAVWQRLCKFVDDSKNLPYPVSGRSAFYSVTHAAVQSFLAAGKGYRKPSRTKEEGIKCALHGDLEIIRFGWKDGEDKNPRPGDDPFWVKLRENWPGGIADFKETERLSSIALIKRVAPKAVGKSKDHPLNVLFAGGSGFPSTTRVALADWLKRLPNDVKHHLQEHLGRQWAERLTDVYHESEGMEPDDDAEAAACLKSVRRNYPIREDDKYYAVLMMDGDRMGKLVNGENLGARWKDVFHPEVCRKLEHSSSKDPYQEYWKKHLPLQRQLSPAVHAALSEALSDFSLQSVPQVIGIHQGWLIYAGGDDVCAVLPLSTAVEAAYDIARAYRLGFVANGMKPSAVTDVWKPGKDRLFYHLGCGEGISISGGLLVTHHKRPLTAALARAHALLNAAKDIGGRNALALEVDRRAGAARRFMTQWDGKPVAGLELHEPAGEKPVIEHFIELCRRIGTGNQLELSTSLIYRLEELKPGLQSIADSAPQQLPVFLQTLMGRSGEKQENKEEQKAMAERMAALLLREDPRAGFVINPEPLIIARFLVPRMAENQKSGEGGNEVC